MGKRKIDRVELEKMLRSGKSQRECARILGVTESAISQNRRGFDFNVIKSVALENAHRIVDKNLDTIDQLQKINIHANKLLDSLMKDCQQGNGKMSLNQQELALKAMAEIRGQLRLQLEIFQTLYDMKAVEEFQKEVLGTIGEVSPDVRRRIIDRLSQARAIRTTVKF